MNLDLVTLKEGIVKLNNLILIKDNPYLSFPFLILILILIIFFSFNYDVMILKMYVKKFVNLKNFVNFFKKKNVIIVNDDVNKVKEMKI